MKIAVMGTGAMGGYIGARLAEAGANVAFVARGAHLAALRERGLKVTSLDGDIHLRPALVTDDPGEVGAVDLILLGVKLYDVEAAVRALVPMVGPDTGIVSLQNGVETPEIVSRLVSLHQNVPGISWINGEIAEPGVIRHNSGSALILGEMDGRSSDRLQSLLQIVSTSSLDIKISKNIVLDLWRKLLILTPMAGVSTLTRVPLGRMRATSETRGLFDDAIAEVIAVAHAEGVALEEKDKSAALKFIETGPANWRGSLMFDLEAGRRLEVAWLHGTICRLGERHGIGTPFHRIVLGALMPHADGLA